jgi:N-acetylglucosamine repressor
MADHTLARHVNELGVLTLLRTQGSASRAELARKLAVTPATITRLMSGLLQRNLVREVGGGLVPVSSPREPGRPGVHVALEPSGAYFFGAEIGVGIIRSVLVDLTARVVAQADHVVAMDVSPVRAVDIIAGELARLQHDQRFAGRVNSLGLTVPGLVRDDGHVLHTPILGWRDVKLASLIADRIPLACLVENGANAAAFGALYTQPALPSECAIFLKLGTGCGGAAIINGRVLKGARGMASEFGHMRLGTSQERCKCGQVGCFETEVNLAGFARMWPGSAGLAPRDCPEAAADAARGGDAAAIAAISRYGERLGAGLGQLINIFNPNLIMLGGVMRPVLALCLAQLQQSVADSIVPGMDRPDVRLSPLGLWESAVGAACLAHQAAFDISHVDLATTSVRSGKVVSLPLPAMDIPA